LIYFEALRLHNGQFPFFIVFYFSIFLETLEKPETVDENYVEGFSLCTLIKQECFSVEVFEVVVS